MSRAAGRRVARHRSFAVAGGLRLVSMLVTLPAAIASTGDVELLLDVARAATGTVLNAGVRPPAAPRRTTPTAGLRG